LPGWRHAKGRPKAGAVAGIGLIVSGRAVPVVMTTRWMRNRIRLGCV